MKTVFFGLLGVLLFLSCRNTTHPDAVVLQNTLVQHSPWRIASFIEYGEDATAEFDGYEFTFNDNGNFRAVNGNRRVNGNYQIFVDDGVVEMMIQLPLARAPFNELHDDWYNSTLSETEVRFEDPYSSPADVLLFKSD